MTGWKRPDESAIALAAVAASALLMATCSGGRGELAPPANAPALAEPPVTASAPPPPEAPALAAIQVASRAEGLDADEKAAQDRAAALPADPAPRSAGHELDNFYAQLRGLEQHALRKHVRVAWLGDSHGAADLWSGPLRAALQTKFGAAGPGFVHVGYKAYRHEGVHIEIGGRWAPLPRGPSTAVRTGDGVFGLGGIVLSGSADQPRTTLAITDPSLPTSLSWDLCYKLATVEDAFQVNVTGEPERVVKAAQGQAIGALRHLAFTTSTASPTMRLVPLGGQPGFCGVTIETDPATQPGVVLDTLGINGARLTTPLAWAEDAWVAELARRPPTLVVVEYGTNESGDPIVHPDAYADNLKRLMMRVRSASPSADCLVLAPTDRIDTEERTPEVRDALHDAAKANQCSFWDTYATMGGKGSISRWRSETPPRAARDGVHLTPRGYRELGDKLASDVLAGYKP